MKFVLLIFIAQDTFLANHFLHHALVALRKGWRVVVATNITSQEVILELQRYGIEVVDTQVQRKTIGPWSEMSSVFRLVKIINEVKPNVIHNYGTKYIIYATAAAKISKVRPVIINNLTGLGIVFSIKKKLLILLCVF